MMKDLSITALIADVLIHLTKRSGVRSNSPFPSPFFSSPYFLFVALLVEVLSSIQNDPAICCFLWSFEKITDKINISSLALFGRFAEKWIEILFLMILN